VVFSDNEGRLPSKHLHPLHLTVNSYNSTDTTVEKDSHIGIPSNGIVEINLKTPNKTGVDRLEIKVTGIYANTLSFLHNA
jgi:hypothetical protein